MQRRVSQTNKSIIRPRDFSANPSSSSTPADRSPTRNTKMETASLVAKIEPKKEIKGVQTIDLAKIKFSTLVGEGAFGKVRKCY